MDWHVALLAVALLAGFVRGFSGFGGGMIFVPLASLLYGPQLAVVWLFVADNIATLPLLPPAFRKWNWRAVLPLAVGAIAATPLGVYALKTVNASLLRWLMCSAVFLTVLLLAAGARYTRKVPWAGSVGIGGVSGLMGAGLGMSGPPVVLLWLGSQDSAGQTRANLIAYFALIGLVEVLSFVASGLMTWPRIIQGIGITIAYGLALLAGMRIFSRSSDRHYRYVALAICAFAALMGLPLWRHG